MLEEALMAIKLFDRIRVKLGGKTRMATVTSTATLHGGILVILDTGGIRFVHDKDIVKRCFSLEKGCMVRMFNPERIGIIDDLRIAKTTDGDSWPSADVRVYDGKQMKDVTVQCHVRELYRLDGKDLVEGIIKHACRKALRDVLRGTAAKFVAEAGPVRHTGGTPTLRKWQEIPPAEVIHPLPPKIVVVNSVPSVGPRYQQWYDKFIREDWRADLKPFDRIHVKLPGETRVVTVARPERNDWGEIRMLVFDDKRNRHLVTMDQIIDKAVPQFRVGDLVYTMRGYGLIAERRINMVKNEVVYIVEHQHQDHTFRRTYFPHQIQRRKDQISISINGKKFEAFDADDFFPKSKPTKGQWERVNAFKAFIAKNRKRS